jgi:hypothetical protein
VVVDLIQLILGQVVVMVVRLLVVSGLVVMEAMDLVVAVVLVVGILVDLLLVGLKDHHMLRVQTLQKLVVVEAVLVSS